MSGPLNFIGKALPFGGLGLLSTVIGHKPKAPVQQQPVIDMPRGITRNDAMDAAMRDDERRRRRGMGANLLTGPMGAEAQTAGGKVLLGQ